MSKSSRYLCKFDVSGDLQAETLQQDCLMFGRAADASLADRDAGACGEHNIDQGDLLELGEDLARLSPRAARWRHFFSARSRAEFDFESFMQLSPVTGQQLLFELAQHALRCTEDVAAPALL